MKIIEEKEEILSMLKEGYSQKYLQEKFGIGNRTIRNWIVKHKIDYDGVIKGDFKTIIEKLYLDNNNVDDIKQIYHISKNSIGDIIKHLPVNDKDKKIILFMRKNNKEYYRIAYLLRLEINKVRDICGVDKVIEEKAVAKPKKNTPINPYFLRRKQQDD